jgi:hypothetical protein
MLSLYGAQVYLTWRLTNAIAGSRIKCGMTGVGDCGMTGVGDCGMTGVGDCGMTGVGDCGMIRQMADGMTGVEDGIIELGD